MITLTYGAILGIIFVYLSWVVSQGRMKTKTSLGAGANDELERDIRIHGNFAEYVPFALVLIGLLEASDVPNALIRWLGGALVIARLLNIWGLKQPQSGAFGRVGGTIGTWLIIVVASGMGLFMAVP